MLELAKRGEFNVVIVYKLDRAGRSVADLFATVDMLKQHGCPFICATLRQVIPNGSLLFTMLGAL